MDIELRNPGALFNIGLTSGGGGGPTVRVLSLSVSVGDNAFDVRSMNTTNSVVAGTSTLQTGVE